MRPSFTLGSGLAPLPFWAGPGLPVSFLLGCAEFPSSFVGVVLIVPLAQNIEDTMKNEKKKKRAKKEGSPPIEKEGTTQTLGNKQENMKNEELYFPTGILNLRKDSG